MSTLPEQFSAAGKSQVETQVNFFQNYAASTVDKVAKIVALNLSTTRASMEKSSAAMRQLLGAHDPRDLLALTTQAQENVESMLAYGRQLFSIAAGGQPVQLKQAAPVIAPPAEPEAPHAKPLKPAKPALVPEAKAAPAPTAAPAEVPVAKPKPIAKAVAKVAAVKAVPAEPAAAPIPAAAAPVVVTTLKAVEAAPPAAEPKQLDMLAPKTKKKK
jgi:phasin family protein